MSTCSPGVMSAVGSVGYTVDATVGSCKVVEGGGEDWVGYGVEEGIPPFTKITATLYLGLFPTNLHGFRSEMHPPLYWSIVVDYREFFTKKASVDLINWMQGRWNHISSVSSFDMILIRLSSATDRRHSNNYVLFYFVYLFIHLLISDDVERSMYNTLRYWLHGRIQTWLKMVLLKFPLMVLTEAVGE